MNYSTLEGVVSNLDRTTHVSGGGETSTTTTHLCLFSLAGERVLLRSPTPAMIADGDQVRLVGQRTPGQFTAIACRNLSTGWTTEHRNQGCAIWAITAVGCFGLVLTWIIPLFFFFPLFCGAVLFLIMRADYRMQNAHLLLNR